MRKVWTGVIGWLRGKKTYLLAVLLVLVTVGLIAWGKLTPETACAVLLFFVAMFAASYRSALANHQAEIVWLLSGELGRRLPPDLRRHVIAGATKFGVAAPAKAAAPDTTLLLTPVPGDRNVKKERHRHRDRTTRRNACHRS